MLLSFPVKTNYKYLLSEKQFVILMQESVCSMFVKTLLENKVSKIIWQTALKNMKMNLIRTYKCMDIHWSNHNE